MRTLSNRLNESTLNESSLKFKDTIHYIKESDFEKVEPRELIPGDLIKLGRSNTMYFVFVLYDGYLYAYNTDTDKPEHLSYDGDIKNFVEYLGQPRRWNRKKNWY